MILQSYYYYPSTPATAYHNNNLINSAGRGANRANHLEESAVTRMEIRKSETPGGHAASLGCPVTAAVLAVDQPGAAACEPLLLDLQATQLGDLGHFGSEVCLDSIHRHAQAIDQRPFHRKNSTHSALSASIALYFGL